MLHEKIYIPSFGTKMFTEMIMKSSRKLSIQKCIEQSFFFVVCDSERK